MNGLATGNLFLDRYTAPGDRIRAALRRVALPMAMPIASNGAAVTQVIFPSAGAISTVVRMHDGTDVEASFVGREALHGVQLALGDDLHVGDAMVQMAGSGWSVEREVFRDALRDDATLRAACLRYASALLSTVMQSAACNRFHVTGARMARWLLTAHDRANDDRLFLTQEFLAAMLGVRRPGVSIAAAALERSGTIVYTRGRIDVLDRPGLEAKACECYSVTTASIERLLGYRLRDA